MRKRGRWLVVWYDVHAIGLGALLACLLLRSRQVFVIGVILASITLCTAAQQETGVIMLWWLFVPACWICATIVKRWSKPVSILLLTNALIYGSWPFSSMFGGNPNDWILTANAVILVMFATCVGGAIYDRVGPDMATMARRWLDRISNPMRHPGTSALPRREGKEA